MSEIIANVTGIKKDMARNGKPFYRVALDNGDTLFAWDWNIIKGIQRGDKAKLTIEKSAKGNFSYIAAAEPYAGEDVSDDSAFPGEEENDAPDLSPMKKVYQPSGNQPGNNIFITRMSALKTAVDYCNYCKPTDATKWKPLTEADLIDMALLFVKFIENGESVEDM